MDLQETVRGRDRLLRAVVAAILGIVALSSLRKGKRLRGTVAGAGAVALGYSVASSAEDLPDPLDREGPTGDDQLRCAACGEPIRPGQPRGPNEDGDIVHDACRA